MVFCQLNRKRCDLRGKRSTSAAAFPDQQPLILEFGKASCKKFTTQTVFNLINTESVAENTQLSIKFGLKSGSKVLKN